MNKKLIFRILGALASALIIVSVFVPFVSVTGHSYSLWQSSELTKSLYLPITLICFGVIGVVFFSLNIKTEFAYMSTGAITFFLIVQTVEILNQGPELFKTLGVGYYFLLIGDVLMGIMTFLLNLKSKQIQEPIVSEITEEKQPTSLLSQIDKLYDNNLDAQSNTSAIQVADPTMQSIQSIQPLQSELQPIQPIQQEQIIVDSTENQSLRPLSAQLGIQALQTELVSSELPSENQPEVQPVVQPIQPTVQPQQSVEPIQPIVQPQQAVEPIQSINSLESIPVGGTSTVNPVLAQFASVSSDNESVQKSVETQSEPLPQIGNNPVVQSFLNTGASISDQSDNDMEATQSVESSSTVASTFLHSSEPQPAKSNESVDAPQPTNSLDIFGQ